MGIRRLWVGPVGPGSTFTVLAAAEEAARAGRTYALVFPTRPASEHARNELARRTGHCDPRVVFTFQELARHLLGTAAPTVASARERDALLAHALSATAASADALPEHSLALRYRGFRRGLLYVFDELEANGLGARALGQRLRAARLAPERVDRLTDTFEGYRRELRNSRLVSRSDLLHRATQALTRGREAAPVPDLLLFDGFTDLSPRQIELLEALALKAGETVITWPVADPGATTRAFSWPEQVRARLTKLGFEEQVRSEKDDSRPTVLRRLARDLFAEQRGEPVQDASGLRIVRAASRRDEVEYALARAREFVTSKGERRWTDVLVVVPDIRRYRAPLEQVGRELGVPVRVRGPVSLATSPLVQGALAFLRAAATYELAPLLVAAACPALGLEPDEADRLARAARRRGLPAAGSPELWVALARKLQGPAGRFLDLAMELGLALETATVPDAAGRVTTHGGCGAMSRALERLLHASSLALLCEDTTPQAVARAASEVAARRDLMSLLADLERLAVPLVAPQDSHADSFPALLLGRLEEEVRATDTRPRDRRRHVLHVVDAREARAWEADLVLVLGLVEKEFPRAERDDLFLPEDTRRALSARRGRGRVQLRTADDRAAEEVFLFYSAITRARRELWLLYPGFSPSGNPLRPSRFLEATRELLSPEAWEAASVLRTPGDLVSDEPELLLTAKAARRFAYRRVSSVSRPSGPEAPRVLLATAVFDALMKREHELQRAATSLGQPVAELPMPLGDLALQRVYSASELETYATCPFRHFVRYLLGVRKADDLAETGLDALRQGTVVHAALQRVYEHGDTPADALAVEFERGARELDIGLEEDAFRQQALASLEAFVAEDDPAFRRATRLEPHAFEAAFGPETPGGALEIEAPGLGGTIRLRGKIDRIDVLPETDGEQRSGFVTDYKLGGREVDGNYLSAMHAGEKLQIPIYLMALQRVLGIKALGAGFAALGTRRRTGIIDPKVDPWENALDDRHVRLHRVPLEKILARTEDHIRRYVGGIAAGYIQRSPRDASDCDRCDAQDVCRTDRWEARRIARSGRPLALAGRWVH